MIKKRTDDSSNNIIFSNITRVVILLYCCKCVFPSSAVSFKLVLAEKCHTTIGIKISVSAGIITKLSKQLIKGLGLLTINFCPKNRDKIQRALKYYNGYKK